MEQQELEQELELELVDSTISQMTTHTLLARLIDQASERRRTFKW